MRILEIRLKLILNKHAKSDCGDQSPICPPKDEGQEVYDHDYQRKAEEEPSDEAVEGASLLALPV